MIPETRLKEIKKDLNPTPAEVLAISTELLSFRNKYGVSIRKKTDFTPPTIKEVEDYADTIKFKIDARYFVDYYQRTNWCFKSGLKMKDWKATVRTWKQNEEKRSETTVRTWGKQSLAEALR